VKVQISRIDALPAMLEAGRRENQNVILLFASIQDALAAYEAGAQFSHLNLGNIHEHPGSREVTPTVFLNDDDVSDLRKLQQRGVEIEIRAVSRDRALPAHRFLR